MVVNRENYCREFHTKQHTYQLEVDINSFYAVLKLEDETLCSDTFQYFSDNAAFIKEYENGSVYKWLVRVLSSIELDNKHFEDWTDFSA